MNAKLLIWTFLLLVFVDFSASSQTSYLIQQDFSGSALPAGWTNTNSKSASYLWRFNNPGTKQIYTKTNGNGFAIFDNEYFANSNSDAKLVTAAFDASAKTYIYLSVSQKFESGGTDTARILVSGNDGASWTQIAQYIVSSANPSDTVINISSIASGKSAVKVMFRFSGNGSGYWAIDDVNVYEPYIADAGVASIETPVSDCKLSNLEPVKITIQNYGAVSISGFDVNYKIGSSVVTELFPGTISAHSTASFTFNAKCDLSAISAETIKAFTSLPGEQNTANDTIKKIITNLYQDISVTPYVQGFGFSDPKFPFYTESNSGSGSNWFKNTGFFYEGPACFTYNGNGTSDWLFTHCFSLDTSKVYQIKFYANTWDNTKKYSLNFFAGDAPSPAGMNHPLIQKSNVTANGWTLYSTAIKPTSAGNTYFGWNLSGELNALPSLDYFTITLAPQKTIGISNLVSPQNGCVPISDSVKVAVTNFGQQPATNFNIVCKINSVLKANVLFTGVLAPGSTRIVALPLSNVFTQSGSYMIDCYTIWADDEDVNDDKFLVTITNSAKNPYLDYVGTGFEAYEMDGWIMADGADANSVSNWNLSSFDKNYGFSSVASYVSQIVSDDWFISDCIAFEASGSYSFTFFTKNSNNGKTRFEVWAGKSREVDSMTIFMGAVDDYIHGTFFANHYIAMPSPGEGIYYVGLRAINAGTGILYLDDIRINKASAIDPGIAGFSGLFSGCYADSLFPVSINLVNYGSEPVSNLPVSLYNGYQYFYETVSATIQPGDTLKYTFNAKLEMTYQSEFPISANVDMPGDANYSNNAAIGKVGSSLINAKYGTQSFSSYETKYWLFNDFNNDSCTWTNNQYSNSLYYQGLAEKTYANDWMFSNCYLFQKGTKYVLNLTPDYNNLPPEFKIYLCSQRDTSSIIEEVHLSKNHSFEVSQYYGWLTVPDSGIYYLAFALEGRLQPYETLTLYSLGLSEIPDHDIAITDISKPVSGCGHTLSDTVEIKIANFGKTPETQAQFKIMVDGIEYNTVLNFNVNPFDTILVKTSLTLDLTKKESYYIEYFVTAPGDMKDENGRFVQILESDLNLDIAPYYYVFSLFDEKSVIRDENKDGNTFVTSYINDTKGLQYSYNSNTPDEWVISRCFKFEKGKIYKVQFDYTSDNLKTNLSLWAGTSQDPSGMNAKLLDLSPISASADTSVFKNAFAIFNCDSSGIYYFGWHISGAVESGRIWLTNAIVSHTIKRDIVLDKILSPRTDCNSKPEYLVTFPYSNSGFEEISKLPVHYTIDGGITVINDTIPLIGPYEVSQFTFKKPIKTRNNIFDLAIWIDLPGDEFPLNDTTRSTVQLLYHDFKSGNYVMSFEDGQNLYSQYLTSNILISPAYGPVSPSEGLKYAVSTSQGGIPATLTTHCFSLSSSDTYTLAFADMMYSFGGSMAMTLEIDTVVDFTGSPVVLYTRDVFENGVYGETTTNFSVPKSAAYYLRWKSIPSGSTVYYILDNIRISSKCAIQTPALPADTMFCAGFAGILSVGNYKSYNWSNNQHTQSITVTSPGIYKVDVETFDGCLLSDSVTVTFGTCVSANPAETENDIRIFPNPANNRLTIELKSIGNSSILKIMDMTGKLVYIGNLSGITKTLDISNFDKGIYVLQLNDSKNLYTRKFIKE
jgi:hypothetical protein